MGALSGAIAEVTKVGSGEIDLGRNGLLGRDQAPDRHIFALPCKYVIRSRYYRVWHSDDGIVEARWKQECGLLASRGRSQPSANQGKIRIHKLNRTIAWQCNRGLPGSEPLPLTNGASCPT